MFYDVFRFVRSLWEAVLLPYVVLSIANLASDGWEAVTHVPDALVVLFYFLCGCSHKPYPLSRSEVDTQRAALAARTAVAASAVDVVRSPMSSPKTTASPTAATPSSAPRRRGYRANSEDENDADSEAEFPPTTQPQQNAPSTAEKSVANPDDSNGSSKEKELLPYLSPSAENCFYGFPVIQRRLLLGKKGETEEWLPALRGRLLIPPHHPLCVSRSLHQLVSIVIGPIQQPTVATMPTRHPEPQWPPHFLRTSSISNNSNSNNSGSVASGSSSSNTRSLGDPSTDDYSSSNSSATPNTLRHRGAVGGCTASSTVPRYRQASSVVYQRVSSRHLDFSNSRVAPHLIASITAHHVLSYPATRQKVLVMDLDETLCYVSTTTANMSGPPTFSEVIPTASGAELFHVWVRPYARLFLSTAAKLFNLVLFTSASKPYADTILQRIDPDQLLKLRFYRQDCRLVPRGLLKRMCAVAGMKGVSSGSVSRHSVSDCTKTGSNPLGDFNTAPANPTAKLALTGRSSDSSGNESGSPTTHTEDEGTSGWVSTPLESSLLRRPSSNWGGGASFESTEVPSSGAEMLDDTRGTFNAVNSSNDSGRDMTRIPTGEGAATSLSSSSFVADPSCGLSAPDSSGIRGSSSTGYRKKSVVDDFPDLEKLPLNEHAKVLVKDLRVLKVPPELLVMIDNSEECTLVNPENALIISPYIPSLTKGSSNEKTILAAVAAAATIPISTRETARSKNADPVKSNNSSAKSSNEENTVKGGASASAAAMTTASTAPVSADNNSSSKNNRSMSSSGGAGSGASDASAADEALLMGDDMTANEGPEEDEVLLALLPVLECLLVVPDVRSILRLGKLY